MASYYLWVKPKESHEDAFKVKVQKNADIDDLKRVIKKDYPGISRVLFIYSSNDVRCDPGDRIVLPPQSGSVGSSSKLPYYFTAIMTQSASTSHGIKTRLGKQKAYQSEFISKLSSITQQEGIPILQSYTIFTVCCI
jgi:hypothetical protein